MRISEKILFVFNFLIYDHIGVLGDRNIIAKPSVISEYKEFLRDAERYGVEIPKYRQVINITEVNYINGGVVGLCSIFMAGARRNVIVLSRKAYETAPFVVSREVWEWGYKSTLWHELGHCLLELNHYSGTKVDMMSPDMFPPDRVDLEEWESLVERMMMRARQKDSNT